MSSTSPLVWPAACRCGSTHGDTHALTKGYIQVRGEIAMAILAAEFISP